MKVRRFCMSMIHMMVEVFCDFVERLQKLTSLLSARSRLWWGGNDIHYIRSIHIVQGGPALTHDRSGSTVHPFIACPWFGKRVSSKATIARYCSRTPRRSSPASSRQEMRVTERLLIYTMAARPATAIRAATPAPLPVLLAATPV